MKRASAPIYITLMLIAFGTAQQSLDFMGREKVSSISILPPIGQSAPDSARQAAVDVLARKLGLATAGLRIVSPDAFLRELQAKGGLTDYTNLVTLFSQSGLADRESVRRLAKTSEADALLLVNVLDYDEQKGSWWYGKGGKNVCRIQYTLFQAATGDKLWQTLEFRQHDSKVSTNPYPMERVIGDVTDKAISALLVGRQDTDVRQK
jgi:hypothetical protein